MSDERKRWEYAVYKGEECLAIGTAPEICKKLGIKMETFHFYRTSWYKKLAAKGKKRRQIIRIDQEDDE